MRYRNYCVAVCMLIAASVLLNAVVRAQNESTPSKADDERAQEINKLVQQLNDDRAADREEAETRLLELAGNTTEATDAFLQLLPEDSDQMPLAVRERLSRIRQQVEDRVAKVAVEATTVKIDAKEMPIADVFKAIETQTGNKLVDNRQQDADDDDSPTTITIELKDEPFWQALDKVLDKGNMGVYAYGGEEALSIVSRASDERPRFGSANYSGPFRIEVLEVQSQRNLRSPNQQSLKCQVEVAWEPRLKPIALSQPIADINATTDNGQQLTISQPDAVLDVEVPNGTQAAEIIVPFSLPPREVKRITSLRGKLRALVPGRHVKFQFDDLANAAGRTDRRGGVQVTIDDVRKNNAIWEVHMRLALDEDNEALQSHRNWAFQNLSYLVDKDGQTIDNAGLETTRQTSNEVGMAYLFDLPEGVDGLSWVYETPAAIVELPIEYEIKDIELP